MPCDTPAFHNWNLGNLANQTREISRLYGELVRHEDLLNHRRDFNERYSIATKVLNELLPAYLALCPKDSAEYTTTPTDPEKLEETCFRIELEADRVD